MALKIENYSGWIIRAPHLGLHLYAQVLCYYSILEFFHATAIIPMQVLLLLSYYAHFMIEKTPQTQRGMNIFPTGVYLSLHFILTAVTNGQNVTVLMLVVVCLSSVS